MWKDREKSKFFLNATFKITYSKYIFVSFEHIDLYRIDINAVNALIAAGGGSWLFYQFS